MTDDCEIIHCVLGYSIAGSWSRFNVWVFCISFGRVQISCTWNRCKHCQKMVRTQNIIKSGHFMKNYKFWINAGFIIHWVGLQWNNERVFYVSFNALLGYIGTAISEGMKGRIIVLSEIHKRDTNPHY